MQQQPSSASESSHSHQTRKSQPENAFSYCPVCVPHSHTQGRKHVYSQSHIKALNSSLDKFRHRIEEIRFFLGYAIPSDNSPSSSSAQKIWCICCSISISNEGAPYKGYKILEHLASEGHIQSMHTFWKQNLSSPSTADSTPYIVSAEEWQSYQDLISKRKAQSEPSKMPEASPSQPQPHPIAPSFPMAPPIIQQPLHLPPPPLPPFYPMMMPAVPPSFPPMWMPPPFGPMMMPPPPLPPPPPPVPQPQMQPVFQYPGQYKPAAASEPTPSLKVYSEENEKESIPASALIGPSIPTGISLPSSSSSQLPSDDDADISLVNYIESLKANNHLHSSSISSFPIEKRAKRESQPFSQMPPRNRATASAAGDNLRAIKVPVLGAGEGNVHSGALPPWLRPHEAPLSQMDALSPNSNAEIPLERKYSLEEDLAKLRAMKKSEKFPNRVGADFVRAKKLGLLDKSKNWLPNFGRVWNSGARSESKKEFLQEIKQERSAQHYPQSQQQQRPFVGSQSVSSFTPRTITSRPTSMPSSSSSSSSAQYDPQQRDRIRQMLKRKGPG